MGENREGYKTGRSIGSFPFPNYGWIYSTLACLGSGSGGERFFFLIKKLASTIYFTRGMVLLVILPIRRSGTLKTPLSVSGEGTCVLLTLQNRFQLIGFLMEQERSLVMVLILSSGMMYGSVISALMK